MQSHMLLKGTAAAVAARRLRTILGPVMSKEGWKWSTHEVKHLNTSSGDTVAIGEISYKLKTPRNPELVPVNHMIESMPQTVAQHLRWIMQKDLLGQDVFLIGPPGPLRRSIAMQYLELTKREVEYVALSRDTTETDLKQRREIRSGTAFYIDQASTKSFLSWCAVRAATKGRILVLEGLEKAERNVLPVLNNLLENREMQLEDGRFLMSAQRYDKLLQEHTKEELDQWKIVRVSEDFRVIALGLPVPRYKGNPLDPPLRSRFQARDVYYLPFKDQLEILYSVGPNVKAERVSQFLSCATTLCSQESANLGLPDFPVDNLPSAMKVLDLFPMLSAQQLLQRLYPYETMLGKEGRNAVEGVLSRFELMDGKKQQSPRAVVHVEPGNTGEASVALSIADKIISFQVPAGSRHPRAPDSSPSFISTPTHARLLAEMMQSHLVKDMCLIGAKGCGKSVIAKEFAEMLGYSIEPIMLYQYRDGQRELHCVFVDLEKAYDRVPREELWYCMRKSGVAEKYVRVVQDMYERSRTVVRCAVGQTEEFNVEVGLHQGSALSPFLFAIVMDQLSEEVRQESPWTMMFADDIVICSESREQVEENLERWRFALERRGMKVSRSKTEYMCVDEREGSGTVRLQGEEVKKVQEFKYLGSTVQSNGECGKEDMTARDLLQQRYTLPNGDTAWRASPLVSAAQEGKLVLLDGIHRVNLGTLAVLSRLLHDRELALYDGTRLLRWDRYLAVKEELQLNDHELQERQIFPIHPSFRVIALAEPPVVGSSSQQWLSPELLTMFFFHTVRPLAKVEEAAIIHQMTPSVPKEAVEQLLHLTHSLRSTNDPTAQSLASSLSTRQLLRICRRLSQYPEESIAHAVNKACLSRFLPSLARSALQKNLANCSIEEQTDPVTNLELKQDITCTIRDGVLTIGKVSAPVFSPDEKMKVPDVLFYENTQHMMIMEDMLKDFLLGEHLLLVGNQGVGKNKIVDRFLHLMNRPREYLQLHRDTTVQTLTLQPSVRDGIIIYEDSPLVKAVKMGHILVIDEADKAPTNVTCILKTLVESGEMILADGRRIVSDPKEADGRANVITMHPDFRMLVLANRPGFPFLGNDFFGALGDIFSCHAVDNPKPKAELAMLKQYGPDVPDTVLQKLVAAFGELRAMADQGTITYPYSTREVVNIVKHLQKFPDEGLANVVRNVFDFDTYNKDMREVLIAALHKHGIPIGAKPTSVHLAKELPLPDCKMAGYWTINQGGGARRKLLCPTESHRIDIKGPVFLRVQGYPLERNEARAMSFTEEDVHWQLPMNEVNIICDVTTDNDMIYVATCNPVSLYAMREQADTLHSIELYDVFPRTISGVWQPFITVAALGSPLKGQVVLHEEQSNTVLHVDLATGAVRRLVLSPGKEEEPIRKTSNWWNAKDSESASKMCREFAHKNWILFYKTDGNQLDVLDVLEGQVHTITLPINVKAVFLVAEDRWLLIESKTDRKFLLTKPMHMGAEESDVCQLHTISEDSVSSGFGTSSGMEPSAPQDVSSEQLPNENLSAALGQMIVSPNRLVCDNNTYANIVVGFPDLLSPNEVYSFQRKSSLTEGRGPDMFFGSSRHTGPAKRANCVSLVAANQIVRALPPSQVPLAEIYPKDVTPPLTSAYLEVTDLNTKKVKYIPVPRTMSMSPYTAWISKVSDTDVLIAPLGSGGVVTVDMGGYVRVWETGLDNLQRSLLEWRNMIGSEDGRPVQDMYERSRTVVRCAVGQTEEFKVEVGLHQGSALSPFLFAIVMDQLSEEVRQESPWTMMFADDIVICSESREQVEENLERWRFVLERRGMKVSRSKTEYVCVNEREGSGTLRLQGEEVKKVQEFKYLGSTVQSNGECGKEITIQRDSGLDVSAPKHGKIDPMNAPHVGGNQWAGGTGGRDTAGLGGKGGPYRLDAGHKVHQISQAEKDAVPEEVKRAAREMAEKAFKARLKEIQMSEYDAATYERFSGAVRRQVQSLRIILDSLQAKGKERQWLKNQALGELDDAKIIDGLTGEKAIYKRRGELEPELGTPQQKPKRLRLLADVSGSMYRFNGVDGRLERSMEAVCMVMEALENYEHKFKYDIVGHSGDGFDIELVRCDKVPKNNKQRLTVLKTMHAHSQFCMSGDYTLEGTEHAVKELGREEADEHFVIVLSDANLERYGISPDRFARVLTSNPQVHAFAIFIGSLGDQAERLQRTLPAGRSFVAMDTKEIPQILQQIFTSTMLSSA
ncbi:hypothetical protein QTP70_027205 [Hemibagrus guttatus]|uniref:von Willebrand factor A domain-containing protein 8 n=1 Tax=Hemibagrus guttatus TaxID=175788 RepID=A0AAE0R714_9TELE|nr:hypothetical protein QTP70_027205 [Hemibagrus guttatus]